MAKTIKLFIVVIAVAVLLQTTTAQTTHVVGDSMGWLVPPGGPIAYVTWAATQTFTVGDILVFNFTTGNQDVAMVTKEAYNTCNSSNPISLKTTGPANFTLDSIGEYYFIGTMDQHCILGQKLAVNVTAPGPKHIPSPPRGSVTYIVGDDMGWLVPPGGASAYATWAYNKTFIVGDILVFNFVFAKQDVAMVDKEAYATCDTNKTIKVLAISPVKIGLTFTGEHFFTSTYPHHCALGQQLAINVTASGTATSPSGSTVPPPSITSGSSSPVSSAPSSPVSSAQSQVVCGLFITLLSIAMAFF